MWANFFMNLAKKRLGLIGGIIVPAAIAVASFADLLAPYGINEINIRARLAPASAEHLLGADHLGRDLFNRLVHGVRLSIFIGLSGAAVVLIVATIIGMISGYLGGKTDLLIQRFVDAWMAFPTLLILITLMSFAGQGIPQIIVILGISFGIGSSRLVRGAVIGIRENQYFETARAIGTPTPRIIMRHVLPNIAPILIIIYTLTIESVIITESVLSFLGFGLPPDIVSAWPKTR